MCRVLGVSRSGWYASCKRARPTAREIRDGELLEKIRATLRLSLLGAGFARLPQKGGYTPPFTPRMIVQRSL